MGKKYKVLRKEVESLRAEIARLRKLVTGNDSEAPAKKAKAAGRKAAPPAKKSGAGKIVKSRPLARATTPRPLAAEQTAAAPAGAASL